MFRRLAPTRGEPDARGVEHAVLDGSVVLDFGVASAFAHALVGAAVGLLARGLLRAPARSSTGSHVTPFVAAPHTTLARRLPWLTALAAAAPDLDVVMHAFVPYSHPFGHRGAFHSLGAYALCSVLAALLPTCRGNRAVIGCTSYLALASHSLLDMLTNGGLGVALWWPLSTERLFFEWRPIPVSPLSVGRFFSARGLYILSCELPFALPCFVAAWLVSRAKTKSR